MPGAVANPRKGGKGPHEKEDAFLRAVDRLVVWVRRNTVAVVVGAVALALLVGGALWYISYQQNLEERADRRLGTLRSEIATGQNPSPVAALSDFLERFGGTEAGMEARILLSRQYLRTDRPSEAVATIEPAVDATRPDTPTGFATRRIQARAHEAAGDTDRALELLAQLEERARFAFQRRLAAAERARILREAGRLQEALAIYERLAAETEESEASTLYGVRAGEIRGMMAGSDDTAGPGSSGEATGGSRVGGDEAGS